MANAVALLSSEVGRCFPEAVLAAADRGEEVLQCAVGRADLGTWFDLSSLTKPLCTTLLVMRMVDRGELLLDEEVMPGVSVRHLLAHAGGLPAWLPLHEGASAAPDPRAHVVAAARAAARGPSGAAAVYSDLGFILLGDLIEARGGDRLDRLFAALTRPLGVEVGFRPLDAPVQAVPARRCAETRTEGHVRLPLQGVVHDDNARAMLGVSGHAGLFGTARGVSRMAHALVETYHDEDTPLRRALGLSSSVLRDFWRRDPLPGLRSTWGLGWDHPSPVPTEEPGRISMAGARWPEDGVGHLGFTGCSLWIDPARRRWVVLLSSRVNAASAEEARAAQARMKALRPAIGDALVAAWDGGGPHEGK